jgi:probable HAF family extracellular repeat protein
MPDAQALAAVVANLSAWAPALLAGLTRACVQGGLFVATVWVLCQVFPRLPATLRYALWWLACLKIVVTVFCAGFVPLPVRAPVTVPLPSIHHLAALTTPAAPRRDVRPRPETVTPASRQDADTPFASETPGPAAAPLPLPARLALAYLAGLIAFAVGPIRGTSQIGRATRRATPVEEEAAREAAREIAARLRLRRTPALYESPRVVSPFVVGAFRPVILLPTGFTATVTPEGLRLALAHEMAHVRRGDLLLGAVPHAARTLLFFFPPAALACRECEQAREEACDAVAVAACGSPPARYGRLLLSLAEGRSVPTALGMAAADFARLRRRLAALRRGDRSLGRPARFAAALLGAVFATAVIPWRPVAFGETLPRMARRPLAPLPDAPRYTVTDIGTLGGATSYAFAVSDTGTVVGSANVYPVYGRGHAFVADGEGGPLTDLTADSLYERSVAVAVNAEGLVAATAYNRPARPQAFLWDGRRHYIGSLPGYRFSQAAGISDAGVVVGTAQKGRTYFGAVPARAFLYRNGRMEDLGTLGGPYSMASAVNAAGTVVGKADLPRGRDASGPTHAFLYQSESGMRDLGTLPGGQNSRAYGLNASGEVVGFSETGDGVSRAFLVAGDDPMRDLGTLPGGGGSVAYAVSDAGPAVGAATLDQKSGSETHAVLWLRSPGDPGGRVVDLNACIPADSGWTLETARAINGRGWIVGQGRRNGQRRAFLLKPQHSP